MLLGSMPQEAERSVSSFAALRVGPQYAVTSTSLPWHSAMQVPDMQSFRIMRTSEAGPDVPDTPWGPRGPGGPIGPGSPFGPCSPGGPGFPLGPGTALSQLANMMRKTITTHYRITSDQRLREAINALAEDINAVKTAGNSESPRL